MNRINPVDESSRTRPFTRSELIQKGLLKPAQAFFALHPDHPERERYCMKLIVAGICPWLPVEERAPRGDLFN